MANTKIADPSSQNDSAGNAFDRETASATANQAIQDSIAVKKRLSQKCLKDIVKMVEMEASALMQGKKVIFFGNGGSAADAQHIAAELVGKLRQARGPLNALSLTTNTSILTAIGNDFGFEHIFSRQVRGCANGGDIVIGISTSGRSKNVVNAIMEARKLGARTIALTGGKGGELVSICDHSVIVPSEDVQRIQECHIMIGHITCELVEKILRTQKGMQRSPSARTPRKPL